MHAVVNGEIYDYDRLRDEMTHKIGYKFQGTSDCELVLALYKCYGLSFLSRLRGEFSLCLFDSKENVFIAVRDRYGIKPLFWTIIDGELQVGAEIKAFLPLGWKPEWDILAISTGKYQMGSKTIFKDVEKVGLARPQFTLRYDTDLIKVLPGHYLLCDASGTISKHQYWDMTFPPKVTPSSRWSLLQFTWLL